MRQRLEFETTFFRQQFGSTERFFMNKNFGALSGSMQALCGGLQGTRLRVGALVSDGCTTPSFC